MMIDEKFMARMKTFSNFQSYHQFHYFMPNLNLPIYLLEQIFKIALLKIEITKFKMIPPQKKRSLPKFFHLLFTFFLIATCVNADLKVISRRGILGSLFEGIKNKTNDLMHENNKTKNGLIFNQ